MIKSTHWTPETLLIRNESVRRHVVKRWVVRWGLKELKCERCGITEWMGQPAPIDLDHVNGDKHDHRLENLAMLCANCHRQTPTHGWKNARLKKINAQCGNSATDLPLEQEILVRI